ncbi:hypothetical protein VCUG_00611 [Vavraia culicis subsp. floridensis]|uniref:HECT-type E3 ubiquitin transferase n=1 Tax=Vavraia culicis (isolate floridensis) TaxID=948595 RepID=L2GW61_VAVCU|nr:uncharacterized protein VCUG_00611 [Vavraia culicis subsp. floridensis]ELA47891.1 hypothetical protein VCUG_00611 [Vavraia culicis subsp. floridensis]
MILHITNAYIKSTSWKSFFTTEKIALAITETNNKGESTMRTLSLKCKNGPLNYFHFFDEDNKLTIGILKNGRSVHCMNVEKTSNRLAYADGGLKITLELQLLNCDIFTYLENKERKKSGLSVIEQISKVIEVYSVTEHRMSHDDRVYKVDKTNFCTNWQNTTIDQVSSSKGWEQIRTRKQIILWVNHSYQLVYLPGRTPIIVESEIERKTHAFYNALQRFETFKYLIFTKFALFTIRGFFVQSTASYFLRSEENMLRRNLHIKIKDEIGEDEGGIKNEFFNEVGLEIANDKRMVFTGNFLDVNRNIYDNDPAEEIDSNETQDDNHVKNVNLSMKREHTKTAADQTHPYDLSSREVNTKEMKKMKEQMLAKLSFSRQSQMDPTATLKFWQSPEARNKKFIEDTDPSFYVEENINTNLLSNDEFYAYLGTFIALCFLNHEMISVKFSLAFWENLMGRKFTLRHVQDTQMQRNLLYVLREELSEDFLNTFDDDLIHTDKGLFVEKTVYESLFLSKKRAYDIIRFFFYSLMPKEFQEIYATQDIYYVLNGKEEITFNFLKSAFQYIKCSEGSREIVFLLNIFKRKNEAYYRKFLKFVTGSENIPLQSNKLDLFKIYIEQIDVKNALFRASSCVKMLFIGCYDTEDEMERIMDFSIFNTEGFHKI